MKIEEKWKKFIKEDKFDFDALRPKDDLHSTFWINGNMNPRFLKQLITISQDIIDSMNLSEVTEDVILTGSMASYNWHKNSDLDLHIVLDFSKLDENIKLVKDFLDQSRINWNMIHDIYLEGHEVELYFQDINEIHKSLGVYSVLDSKWLQQPSKSGANLDLKTSEKKADAIQQNIQHVKSLFNDKEYKKAHDFASKIKKKIRNMRQAGLSREGIYSAENLAFKMLRNNGSLDNLSSLKVSSYDKMMSLSVSESKNPNFVKIWSNYSKNGKI